jgi:hypothetical protein
LQLQAQPPVSGGQSQGEYADRAYAERAAQKCPEPYSRRESLSVLNTDRVLSELLVERIESGISAASKLPGITNSALGLLNFALGLVARLTIAF